MYDHWRILISSLLNYGFIWKIHKKNSIYRQISNEKCQNVQLTHLPGIHKFDGVKKIHTRATKWAVGDDFMR